MARLERTRGIIVGLDIGVTRDMAGANDYEDDDNAWPLKNNLGVIEPYVLLRKWT